MEGDYETTIGLEIHAELKTHTKMFCNSKNDPDETRANVNVCPVCLAHPGTLPVVNREAVRSVLRVGTALGAKLADYTEFDRKNYFYPDLPKGYQISQYEFPLVSGGELAGVQITRVHLEEDTASSIHDEQSGVTTIDYNRAGVPLMELVTEPVIHSAAEAGNFARELQLLLRYLGASNANMEKGEMRVEANVSVKKKEDKEFGTKVEIKNLNSFRAMERAVAHEIERHIKVLERGEKIVQETRGWDEAKQATFSQRVKEGSADYRYFPDPDIPSFTLSELPAYAPEALRKTLPELPRERRGRYMAMATKKEDADLFVKDVRFGNFFDEVTKLYGNSSAEAVKLASNYLANDLVKIIRDIDARESLPSHEIPISALNYKAIIDLAISGKISSRSAKDLISIAISDHREPEVIAKEKGLLQSTDMAEIEATIDKVLVDNAGVVSDLKAGKAAAMEFLVGQGMKILRGAGNPSVLREVIKRKVG